MTGHSFITTLSKTTLQPSNFLANVTSWHFLGQNNWSVWLTIGLHEMLWPKMCKDLHRNHLNASTTWYSSTGAILHTKNQCPTYYLYASQRLMTNSYQTNHRCLHDCHVGNLLEKVIKHEWINSCNMSPQTQITVITKAHHFLCRNLCWYLPISATYHIQSLETMYSTCQLVLIFCFKIL